jgi:hypothetical protein
MNLQIPASPRAIVDGRLTLRVETSTEDEVVKKNGNTVVSTVDGSLTEADAIEEVVRLEERFTTEAV